MNNTLIRAFLESSLVNAQAHKAVEGCREPRPTHNGDRLAQDIKTLLSLMDIPSEAFDYIKEAEDAGFTLSQLPCGKWTYASSDGQGWTPMKFPSKEAAAKTLCRKLGLIGENNG